jgi:hypothetical protein
MQFQFPAHLGPEATRGLARGYVASGPDGMPGPTEARVEGHTLLVRRSANESGSLWVPWTVNDNGPLMLSTATLVERMPPYSLLVELARGKVNQLRTQASEWETGGLRIPREFSGKLHALGVAFARLVCRQDTIAEADSLAGAAVSDAVALGEQLVQLYVDQVFQARHQSQPTLETSLGCTVTTPINSAEEAELFKSAFNAVRVPFRWGDIESAESEYHWEAVDAVVNWAKNHGLEVHGGPLIDFSGQYMPEWLGLWKGDVQGLANLMLDFVEAAMHRYRETIKVWQLTGSTNGPAALGLEDDDLLNLSSRLTELARQVDQRLHLSAGIAQPWGEYLALKAHPYSPFAYCDMLLRTRVIVNALDIEILMRAPTRGSLSHDLLDISRMLDLYAVLGLPLRVTLGYPIASSTEQRADKTLSPEHQAAWVRQLANLAVCKPYVLGVTWLAWSDRDQTTSGLGLLDSAGKPRLALAGLQALRKAHLR